MSLILKGIDLPKDETIVIHYANRYGEMETVYVDESDIIQIPKNHGRIIDENEAIDNVACFHGTAWLDTDGIEPLLEAEE